MIFQVFGAQAAAAAGRARSRKAYTRALSNASSPRDGGTASSRWLINALTLRNQTFALSWYRALCWLKSQPLRVRFHMRKWFLLLFAVFGAEFLDSARSARADEDKFAAADDFSDAYARKVCAGPNGEGLQEQHEILKYLCGEMANIGRWYSRQQDKIEGGELVQQANLRAQEVQVLMASAICHDQERISGHDSRSKKGTSEAAREACKTAIAMQKTLRAMYAVFIGLSSPYSMKLGPILSAPELVQEVVSMNGDRATNPNAIGMSLSDLIDNRRKKLFTRAMLKDSDEKEYEKYKSKMLDL